MTYRLLCCKVKGQTKQLECHTGCSRLLTQQWCVTQWLIKKVLVETTDFHRARRCWSPRYLQHSSLSAICQYLSVILMIYHLFIYCFEGRMSVLASYGLVFYRGDCCQIMLRLVIMSTNCTNPILKYEYHCCGIVWAYNFLPASLFLRRNLIDFFLRRNLWLAKDWELIL